LNPHQGGGRHSSIVEAWTVILQSSRNAYVSIKQERVMKKQLGTLVMCGVMLVFSAPLLAQSYDHDRDHHDNHHDYDHHDRHYYGNPHYHGMYDQGRHEGWYRKGGYVPANYRGGHYVVTDWRHERLREPPHGYHWVRSDNGDFLLVAITTGIIADLLLNH
jgi:Ni/Co efflux regulator RcnB